jgi:hypothetical protein
MNKEIKINDEQVDINTFVTWFNESLDTLGIDEDEITQEQAEEIAEKFFNNLNEETTS